MRPKYMARAAELDAKLLEFDKMVRPLPGIRADNQRKVLVAQLIESIRRIDYARALRARDVAQERLDPRSELFDPERAALHYYRTGNFDEACWLIFLSTACGKHATDGWRLCRDIYGRLGSNRDIWDWNHVSADSKSLQQWLITAQERFREDGIRRRFNNHRKYSNLTQTGVAIDTYVAWVSGFGGHDPMIITASNVGGNPRAAFDFLYCSMRAAVRHFGRLGCFDYLTMLGKLALAPIEPGSTYIQDATGPLDGANLLFGNPNVSRRTVDAWLVELGDFLNVGMQEIEDSLCNWQKSPKLFQSFKG